MRLTGWTRFVETESRIMLRIRILIVSLAAVAGFAQAADQVGDGVEPEPGTSAAQAGAETIKPAPTEGSKRPLKSIDEFEAERSGAAATGVSSRPMLGTSPEAAPNAQPKPEGAGDILVPEAPIPVGTDHDAAVVSGDLTADRTDATPLKPNSPFAMELDDYKPNGDVLPRVGGAYEMIAELKKQVYTLASDLDNGGKEKTRIIYTTEAMGRNIKKLALVWEGDEKFRDACTSALRACFKFEQEVRNDPWEWKHVRWSFSSLQQEVKVLRKRAAAMAVATAEPIRIQTKEGVVVIDASQDPKDLEAQEQERRRRESERQKERMKEETGEPTKPFE